MLQETAERAWQAVGRAASCGAVSALVCDRSRGTHRRRSRLGLALALLAFSFGCGEYGGGSSSGTGDAASPAEISAAQANEVQAFESEIHPLLRERCATCHDGSVQGIPSFAESDHEEAWRAVSRRDLVRFDEPVDSRLVARLASDGHQCWSNCSEDGLEMLAAIVAWRDLTEELESGEGGEGAPGEPLQVDIPAPVFVEATGTLTQIALSTPTTRGGSPPITFDNDAPNEGFPYGAHLVSWTVRDASGAEVEVLQSVRVIDTTPPTLMVPPPVVVNATESEVAVNLGFASASDLVTGEVTPRNDAPEMFQVGETPVQWRASDDVSNTATAIQMVTVNLLAAGELMIVAPPPVSREAAKEYTMATLGSPTTTGGQPPYDVNHDASYPGFPVGNSVVLWTVEDAAGNTSMATQQVHIYDTIAPTISAPFDRTVDAEGERTEVLLGVPISEDSADPVLTITNDAPSLGFEVGTTVVTWTATDDSGNSASDTQTITVRPLAVSVTAPADRSAEATGAQTEVTLGSATATGGTPPLTITNDAPAGGFGVGTHTVTWTVTDDTGLTGTDTQLVTIEDTTPPILSVPNDVALASATVPVAVSLGEATGVDLSGSSVTISNDAPGGFFYGTTDVVWTATDEAGNSSQGTQRVTVTETGGAVGDPEAGASAYAANCQSCHGADPATNISNIQNGANVPGIEFAIGNVSAMGGLSNLLSQPQTLADIAAFIAEAANPVPPTSDDCTIDEDPMQSIALQRLSKLQYTNTIYDLLHMQLATATADAILEEVELFFAQIPDDHISHGFAGFDQSVTASHVEGWFNVAWTIAGEVTDSNVFLIDFVGESCATDGGDVECRERFVESFGARALRHPLSSEEVAFYTATSDYRELITQFLMAPAFLSHEQYRGELDPSDSNRTQLSAYELASRLSYHFWQTMPDQALFDAAANGDLENDFESVVQAVFDDARTREGLEAFFSGWLRLDEIPQFDTSKPERANFLASDYGYSTEMPTNLDLVAYREAAIDEVLALADYTTFVRDGDLADLFTSNESFASDASLASAYGVSPWLGGSNPPVPFPASQPRAGLLTRAALQMYGDFDSHPILKGARIRTEILCDELVAPADIATPEEAVVHPTDSTRELTEAITEIPGTACAGCHEPFINPVGFPSENFDALGRFRTEEILFDESGDEFYRALVETTTTPRLNSGDSETVDDAVDLSTMIATHAKTHECFARNYYRYEHRRMEVDSTDACEVNALEEALQAEGLQGMLKAAALLPEFKLRTMSN